MFEVQSLKEVDRTAVVPGHSVVTLCTDAPVGGRFSACVGATGAGRRHSRNTTWRRTDEGRDGLNSLRIGSASRSNSSRLLGDPEVVPIAPRNRDPRSATGSHPVPWRGDAGLASLRSRGEYDTRRPRPGRPGLI